MTEDFYSSEMNIILVKNQQGFLTYWSNQLTFDYKIRQFYSADFCPFYNINVQRKVLTPNRVGYWQYANKMLKI